ncbi:DMT family transporter [Aminiphilus sp.]|uniref:DMT family transporter n=1 Tax=Aminiphilus sp. TaxID=1872488 RepID=UPI0026021276|nr:DMT family transporter [Aminiphilus sp.]
MEAERKRWSGDVRTILLADAAMFVIAVFWGSGFGVSSWLLKTLSPMWLLAVRFTLSALFLACVLWRRMAALDRKQMVLAGGLGVFLGFVFFAHIFGLQLTTAGKQSFIAGSNVAMVPFLYALLYRRWPGAVATVAALLTTAGLLVMAFTPSMVWGMGDGLSLLLALGIALHVLIVGNLSRRMDPVGLTGVQMAVTAVFLVLAAALFEPMPHFGALPPKIWGGVVYVALCVTAIPFLVQNVAQRYSPEIHAAILLSLESPFGYVIALLLGQEVLNAQVVLGGVVILSGVLLAESEPFLRRFFSRAEATGS